jgi:hypothetical protein
VEGCDLGITINDRWHSWSGS